VNDYIAEVQVISTGTVKMQAASLEDAIRRSKYIKADDVELDGDKVAIKVVDVTVDIGIEF